MTVGIHGVCREVITDLDGSVGITPWRHNKWVGNGEILLACLMKNHVGYNKGILWFAFGDGDSGWDTSGTPEPLNTQETLLSELVRKRPTINFREGTTLPGGIITGTPSKILSVSVQLDGGPSGEFPGGQYLRERALFGGNASDSIDSGLVFSIENHARVWKDSTKTMVLDWRLLFKFEE